jgi:hypothetical protein
VGGFACVGDLFFHTFVTYDAIYGAYTELYAGLSPELTMEKHNGTYVIPWGRIHPDEKFVRPDVVQAMKPVEEGGLGYARSCMSGVRSSGSRTSRVTDSVCVMML